MGGRTTNPIKRLGTWSTRTLNTVYQAATDGFATCEKTGGIRDATGRTDGANPPTIPRVTNNTGTTTPWYVGFTMPVKKNDYWKIDGSAGLNVFWIPLEP